MIPKICSSCGTVGTEKLSSLYWAWSRADHTRVCYLQKLCFGCFIEQAQMLIVSALQPIYVCPACGIDTTEDHDDIYLTYCLPGQQKALAELPMCGPDAVRVRNAALVGATLMPDREAGSLGAAASPQPISGAQTWASLGIVPGPAREQRT